LDKRIFVEVMGKVHKLISSHGSLSVNVQDRLNN